MADGEKVSTSYAYRFSLFCWSCFTFMEIIKYLSDQWDRDNNIFLFRALSWSAEDRSSSHYFKLYRTNSCNPYLQNSPFQVRVQWPEWPQLLCLLWIKPLKNKVRSWATWRLIISAHRISRGEPAWQTLMSLYHHYFQRSNTLPGRMNKAQS